MHGPNAPVTRRCRRADAAPIPIHETTLKNADSRSLERSIRWYGSTDTRPPRSACSAASRSRSCGPGSVSASRNTRRSPRAALAPRQHAQVLPVQPGGRSGEWRTRAPAAAATIAVASAEWSSTTMISVAGSSWARRPTSSVGSVAASSRVRRMRPADACARASATAWSRSRARSPSRAGMITEIVVSRRPGRPGAASLGTRHSSDQPASHASTSPMVPAVTTLPPSRFPDPVESPHSTTAPGRAVDARDYGAHAEAALDQQGERWTSRSAHGPSTSEASSRTSSTLRWNRRPRSTSSRYANPATHTSTRRSWRS